MKLLKKALLVMIVALFVLAITFFVYFSNYYHAENINMNYLSTSGEVVVKNEEDYYFFDGPGVNKAFIFYQGAKVEEEAYAKFLYSLAYEGVDCFLVKMPFRFAIFGKDRANEILNDFSYEELYIGGHSLGGATASMFYAQHYDKFKGLILIESRSSVLLGSNSNVLSIVATEDGILNKELYEQGKNNLPKEFEEVIIEGGNHSGFANYGEQKGDNEARITKDTQQEQTVNAILKFMDVNIDTSNYSNLPYYFDGKLHGITTSKAIVYESTEPNKKEIDVLDVGINVLITNDTLNDYYQIEYEGKNGFTKRENVSYFVYDATSTITLGCDVSGFNYNTDFKSQEDFELYLLNNKFNYAIIRFGGRGYGKAGNMYYDNYTNVFVDACEYLGIPYGLYFLDEAVNTEEINAEYDFIMAKINDYRGKFNLLPLAIDMENQHGDGRADDIWNERVELINLLVNKLKTQNMECMIYANGARIETYLKDVEANYWTAAYTLDNSIPKVFYDEFIKIEEEKNRLNETNIENSILNHKINLGDTNTIWYSDEYLNKVIAWQFTENAASNDGISGNLDLNLFKNDFFVEKCYEIYGK